MKLPVSWLKEYVDLDDSLERLSDALTFAGIEVEAIETIGHDYSNIVVGEVRAVSKHPNADKLSLCTVFDGEQEWPVVCGAPNVTEGMKTAFAKLGAVMPEGFKIKKAKIRGEVSQGMLCAEDELGLGGGHDGIMNLDASLAAGTPFQEIAGAPETVIEVEITPNRPDCLSMIGVAREVAALYGSSFSTPEVSLKEEWLVDGDAPDIDVKDTRACPRYVGRMLTNVKVGPSPDWMQHRLRSAGMRPVNNVVDITNYVLLETGHPLHAFDFDQLNGGKLHIRAAGPGEPITTLNEQTYELKPEYPVIADSTRPVALAGVMGGANSEIADTTTQVLLEVASFDADTIRASSRELGIHTDSSHRFERGVDPEGVEFASRRAAALMAEYAGAKIVRNATDIYPAPREPGRIPCRWEKIRSLSGIPATRDEIETALASIECRIENADDVSGTVVVPTFRPDLTREVDLVEEFTRLYGLDKIPIHAPNARIVLGAQDQEFRQIDDVKTACTASGLSEVMHYSLTSSEELDVLLSDGDLRVSLPNPISADQSILRTSLLPQMLGSLARNLARQVDGAQFFEIGRAYEKHEEDVEESIRLSIGRYGNKTADAQTAMLQLKGQTEALLNKIGLSKIKLQPTELPWAEPGCGAQWVLKGKVIGVAGLLSSKIGKKHRFTGFVPLAEINLSDCLKKMSGKAPKYVPYSKFPSTSRDISFLIDDSVTHGQIVETIRAAASKELEKVHLFDIFESENIGANKKSMAYSISYRAQDRSFTDEEVNQMHEKVRDALVGQLQATLR